MTRPLTNALCTLLLAMVSLTAMAASDDERQERLRDTMYYYFDNEMPEKFHKANKEFMDYSLSVNDVYNYYNGWVNKVIFELNVSNLFQAYKQALAMSRDMRMRNVREYRYLATNALGLIYADCNNLEGARQCFKETIEQLKTQGMADKLTPYYMDLAYVCIDKDLQEAMKWAQEAIETSSDDNFLCDASAFMSMLQFKKNDREGFRKHYDRYRELVEAGNSSIFGKYADIYNACFNRRYAEAVRMAGAISSPLDRCDYLRQVYDYFGDTLKAYGVMRRQMAISDSLNSIILTDNLQGISNEMEMAAVQQSEARHRIISLSVEVGAAFLLIVALVYILLNRQKFTRRLEQGHRELVEAYNQLEETTTQKERIESELRIARDIQMSMLPHQFPQRQGLDLYASMEPAREVGGDFYDYIADGDMLYFCVGDVSGKGVPASLFMAQTLRLFRALAKQHQMPADICTRLNSELCENNDSGMFVTMFIGLLDMQTGHLDFCNAGHNPPVLGGDNSHGSFLKMESNAPIGLWPDLLFVGEEIASISGRPLFVYSDGLNEAENPCQQRFGDDRLLRVLQQTDYYSSRQVTETMKAEVDRFRDGTESNDDLTMLCLQVG